MNFSAVIPTDAKRSRGTPRTNQVVRLRRPSTLFGMTRCASLMFSLYVILAISSSAFGQSDAEFTKANQEYAQDHFKEAIASYEAMVRSGQWNANLFYDLGNAYFRTRDFGRAILNYERALASDRHNTEATANLQIARDESRALELQATRLERYLQFATINQYSIAAAIAFW